MISPAPKEKTLDLRYNELLNDWDGQDEQLRDVVEDVCGHLVLSWRDLNVTVKQITQKFFKRPVVTYKKILDNVSGHVQCGNLLGIIGPSGSGKTTLLTSISHRTRGNFHGELLLNGRPISEDVMIKISGFVPQHDIAFDQLTALEHLSLMANLKMDRHTTKSEVKEHLDRIISTIGMGAFLNTRISFLSGGERKKVSLAVQMLNDPPILFCDEITTGLDSYSAAHIVNTLKAITRSGKIVVCTIHQPASGVFGKFDEVLLLSSGRLACQGPVSTVRQLFEKYRFDYKCPDLFNEAEFVISILNSDSVKVKRDVDEMCKLSSADQQSDYVNYEFFNDQRHAVDYTHYFQTKKPLWTTQFRLILNRATKCFLRNYQTKLLDFVFPLDAIDIIKYTPINCRTPFIRMLINWTYNYPGEQKKRRSFNNSFYRISLFYMKQTKISSFLTLTFVFIASPYASLQFDSHAVQNWEGFWLMLAIECMFRVSYSALTTYLITSSSVHREIHNGVYSLSAYYVSELMIAVVWLMVKMLIYCIIVFTIVGVVWNGMELIVFFVMALTAFSFGSLLSAYGNDIQYVSIFQNIYCYMALSFSGAYLSINSLPKPFYFLRRFSYFFLCCEMVSIVFWEKIPYLPCDNVNNCLNSGNAVLEKYGYTSSALYSDLTLLISFCILANFFGYFGVLRKMNKQPAY